MVRGYTTIEQSRKLAEILPLESADMYHFINDYNSDTVRIGYDKTVAEFYSKTQFEYIPCWSLAALLGVLPNENMLVKTIDGEYYYLAKDVMTKHYDNPVDACVAMIEKLYELNLL